MENPEQGVVSIARSDTSRIRVTLRLGRSDDPLLFDALALVKKGPLRVGRLRTLAHSGLLAERPREQGAGAESGRESAPTRRRGAGIDENRGLDATVQEGALAVIASNVTAALFDAPLSE